MSKQLETKIARQRTKLAFLDEHIGHLLSQRALGEEALATLLRQKDPSALPATTQNPVVTGGGQPFRGSQMVILEKRTPEGKLDFSGEQPPAGGMIFDEVWALYSRTDPKDWSGSWDTLKAWLDSKGWVVRAKTW